MCLADAVNIKNMLMIQYGTPRSAVFHIDNMITAVQTIYQQVLGAIQNVASRKISLKAILQGQVQFTRQDSVIKGFRLGEIIIRFSNHFIDVFIGTEKRSWKDVWNQVHQNIPEGVSSYV